MEGANRGGNHSYHNYIQIQSESEVQEIVPSSQNGNHRALIMFSSAKSVSLTINNRGGKSKGVKYEDICNFKSIKVILNDIQWLASLDRHFRDLKSFLQNQKSNILFIFGPSGCGKTLLLQSSLSLNNISY